MISLRRIKPSGIRVRVMLTEIRSRYPYYQPKGPTKRAIVNCPTVDPMDPMPSIIPVTVTPALVFAPADLPQSAEAEAAIVLVADYMKNP